LNYLIKRISAALITVFLVSVLCFFAFSVIRGDPASYLAGTDATYEQLNELRESMGLNRNIFIRYFDWLSAFLKGNPGNSISFRGEAISVLIAQRLPVTITLAVLSLLLCLLIALPVSLFTVRREGGIVDNIVNFFTAAGLSTPGFFLGLLFIFIFGFVFRIFVPGMYISYSENFTLFIKSLFFPSLAIAIPNAAILIKFLRGSIFAELKKYYIRTAKSKGAGRFHVLLRHVLKNSLLPAVTVFGMIIAEVFSGSIVIEQVFTIPGIGMLLITAITSRDYPLIQALMVYIAFLVVAAASFADILNMVIDPKIRTSGRIR